MKNYAIFEQNEKKKTQQIQFIFFIAFFTQRFFHKLSRHNKVQLR